MEILRVTRERAEALKLKNDPFSMPGRLIPALSDGIWTYEMEYYDVSQCMVFPDEDYDLEQIDCHGCAFAAFESGECIGLIILRRECFRYLYVEDLKVSSRARRRGVGAALVRQARREAESKNYRGLYLHAQDNNLGACLFYLHLGFRIGGFDNQAYSGTSQQGKGDITFYLDV